MIFLQSDAGVYNFGVQQTMMEIIAKCDRIALVFAILAPLALAQAVGQVSVSFGDPKAPNVLTPGMPFQGERVTKTTMHLQDGTLLVREEYELLGRNVDGRFFDESYRPAASGETSQHHFIFADPIAKREVIWTEGSMTASVNPLQPSTRLNVAALSFDRRIEAAYFPRDKSTITTDDLGSKMIDGVACTGTRTVTTLPAGVIGNTEPLQRSEEMWIATDLQIVVDETDKSPTLGTRTVAMVSLELTPPSSDRFNLPEGLTNSERPGPLSDLPGFPSGISAPVPILSPAAECSDEARRAKYHGVVLVSLTVDAQGNPQNPARDSSDWYGAG